MVDLGANAMWLFAAHCARRYAAWERFFAMLTHASRRGLKGWAAAATLSAGLRPDRLVPPCVSYAWLAATPMIPINTATTVNTRTQQSTSGTRTAAAAVPIVVSWASLTAMICTTIV